MATQLYQSCIDSCQKALLACGTACRAEEDAAMMQRCIALDMDCAEIYRECAKECARHPHEHCQLCVRMPVKDFLWALK